MLVLIEAAFTTLAVIRATLTNSLVLVMVFITRKATASAGVILPSLNRITPILVLWRG